MPANPNQQDGLLGINPPTLIVEDGTIIPGANSYIDEGEMEIFAEQRCVNISGTSSDQLVCFLIEAAEYLDARFCEYTGQVDDETQFTAWPRVYGYYRGKFEIPIDEIPQALKDAQALIVLELINGAILYPKPVNSVDQTGTYISEEKVGPLQIKYGQYANSNPHAASISLFSPLIISKVESVLQPILKNSCYTGCGYYRAIRV